MTRDEMKSMLPLFQAYADGKTIERRSDITERWHEVEEMTIRESVEMYRIKPEPRLRPWRPEEVPVGAQFRFKGQMVDRWLISGTSSAAIRVLDDLNVRCYDFNTAFDRYEWSNDNGKTWHPCGVEITD